MGSSHVVHTYIYCKAWGHLVLFIPIYIVRHGVISYCSYLYILAFALQQNFDVSSLHQCMVRDVARHGLLMPSSTSCSIHDNTPTVTVLGPGNMTVATHHQHNDPRPLTERLKASGEMKTEEMKSSAPSTDSLTQLLVQSVTSGDGKLLEEVLRVPKEKIISATVRKLPVHVVLPFMKKVSICLVVLL